MTITYRTGAKAFQPTSITTHVGTAGRCSAYSTRAIRIAPRGLVLATVAVHYTEGDMDKNDDVLGGIRTRLTWLVVLMVMLVIIGMTTCAYQAQLTDAVK